MPLSTKPPVKVGVITDAIGSVPSARPTHGIVSLRAAMARMALAATRGQTASVALRAALPRFDLNGVRAQTVNSIVMSPSTASVAVSGTAQTTELSAQAFDQSGQPMTASLVWESDNNAIATVDQTGLVTGVALGTCTITVSVGAVQATCDLTVGYDPRTLTPALWWHPAAADVVKDAATGKTSRAIDLSGNGNDATQFTAANEPSWEAAALNGGPALLYASGVSMAGPSVNLSAGCLLALPINPHSFPSFEPVFFQAFDGTSGQGLQVSMKNTGRISVNVYQSSSVFIGRQTSILTANTPIVLTIAWDGTPANAGIAVYANGTRIDTTDNSSGAFTGLTDTTLPVKLGTSFDGEIGDVLLSTAPQNTTSRQALESALLGTTPLFVPPTPPPAFSGTVYVATNGTANGQGTQASPIDEATFLAKGVGPGASVIVRGGVYAQQWIINFGGTEASPINMQVAVGEHVQLSNGYSCIGSDVIFTGAVLNGWLEIYQTDTARVSTQTTGDLSHPDDIPLATKECAISGARSFVIGAIVHDLANGLVSESGGSGAGFIDCIPYNNGWDGTDRAHGHNVYIHNDAANATKTLTRIAAFNSFDIGLQVFARSGAAAHINASACAIVASGAASATYGEQFNIDVSASPIEDLTFDRLSVYRLGSGATETIKINDANGTPATGVTFTNNFVKGAVEINECTGLTATGNTLTTGGDATNDGDGLFKFRLRAGGVFSEDTVDTNTYIAVTGNNAPFYYEEDDDAGIGYVNENFPGWQIATGFDANSTYTEGAPTTPVIRVEASDKEPGRAFIFCYNPADSATLDVPASALVGVLAEGDQYSVWHVYNVPGTPIIATATYDGGAITLPQTGYVPPTPTGYATTPASTSPTHNAFLLRKVA